MSARGDLVTSRPALAALIGAMDVEPTEVMRLLTAYRAEVAHELAERLHLFAEVEDGHLDTPAAALYVQGIQDAADHIDPEVEGG